MVKYEDGLEKCWSRNAPAHTQYLSDSSSIDPREGHEKANTEDGLFSILEVDLKCNTFENVAVAGDKL